MLGNFWNFWKLIGNKLRALDSEQIMGLVASSSTAHSICQHTVS